MEGGDAAAAETPEQRAAAVAHLEHLINEDLKVQLERVLDRRDKLHERIAACLELRNGVKLLLDQNLSSIKTQVNLGCDFYVAASVPDTSSIYVDIGLGMHAQMTLDEAVAFSEQREARLTEAAAELTERSVDLKARIKLALLAIDARTAAAPGRRKTY